MGHLEDRFQQGTPDTGKPVLNLLFTLSPTSLQETNILRLKSKLDSVLYVMFVDYVAHVLYVLCAANTSSIIMYIFCTVHFV